MLPVAALCVSILAFLISASAFTIVYRKEAHRIRLELSEARHFVILTISNDSGIDTEVSSIGYFRRFREVRWLTKPVGDNATNMFVAFPIVVKARSKFDVQINTLRDIPDFDKEVGLCIQLATGRLYVSTQSVGWKESLLMHMSSWVSRVSGGRYALGVNRPRAKLYGWPEGTQ